MTTESVDILLVGSGAMSTTFAMILNELDPTLSIRMVERLDKVAQESTDAWNNAGTGHAAYCELNNTPRNPNLSISTINAVTINAAFEVSLQYWSYLVDRGVFPKPSNFINPVPHQSFVWGEKNVAFLKSRYESMKALPAFREMEYSEDPNVINTWMPLVMKNRDLSEPVAATRIKHGTDVNFGAIARMMSEHLAKQPHFNLSSNTMVTDLDKAEDGSWNVSTITIEDNIETQAKKSTGKKKNKFAESTKVLYEKITQDGIKHVLENFKNRNKKITRNNISAKFVFLGAGSGTLTLLQKSKIKESEKYSGFPVSGQWLICNKPEIVYRHFSKVYGAAPSGAQPMSVPHFVTRIIDGKKAIFFGPFEKLTTKSLKKGSFSDLPFSVRRNNLKPILNVAKNNMDLTKFLIKEKLKKHKDHYNSLRQYYPDAIDEDWKLVNAGQRVQIIKSNPKSGVELEFGTETIVCEDGTLAALLSSSPGASSTVETILDILEHCFPDRVASEEWQQKIKTFVPSYGQSLVENTDLLIEIRRRNVNRLHLAPDV